MSNCANFQPPSALICSIQLDVGIEINFETQDIWPNSFLERDLLEFVFEFFHLRIIQFIFEQYFMRTAKDKQHSVLVVNWFFELNCTRIIYSGLMFAEYNISPRIVNYTVSATYYGQCERIDWATVASLDVAMCARARTKYSRHAIRPCLSDIQNGAADRVELSCRHAKT